MLIYEKFIRREQMKGQNEKLFVFGDNLLRSGLGGQAAEMRGEPNAVGIITKKHPGMNQVDFLYNEDWGVWLLHNTQDFIRLMDWTDDIIWPADGVGTGLAQLHMRAPYIWQTLEDFKRLLERKHNA